MLRTFNNGIGMILIINKDKEKEITNEIEKQNLRSYKIGFIKENLNQKEKVIYKGEYNA